MTSIDARPSPMWLAHHHPDQYERCVTLGTLHVCRRCLVLYPLAVLCAVLVLLTDPPPSWSIAAMWLLPAPVMVEWVGEHLGRLPHSPRRQVVLTALAAPALGTALAWHAVSPFELAAIAPMATWALVGLASALVGRSGHTTGPTWREQHQEDEARRARRLQQLLEDADRASSAGPT
jgi:hypothetical protein